MNRRLTASVVLASRARDERPAQGRRDGRGAARIEPGNGLTGMRERVRAMGGVLEVDGSDGFRVRVTLP